MSAAVDRAEVVVVGGTPGGIAAAVAAARMGSSVVLVERHDHLGGMASSGLGKSDIENRAMIAGIFHEFIDRVHRHYATKYGADDANMALCHDGYYYEPSVAEAAFDALVAECAGLRVLKGWRLVDAQTEQDRLRAISIERCSAGEVLRITGDVFIDATYEGDLFAHAGAEYRLGRESREEFGEPHAGVVYFDYQRGEFLPGSTGAADERLPAYTYRLCLTTDLENSVALNEPPEYDRRRYVGYFDDLAAGRLAAPQTLKPGRGYNAAHFDTLVRALSVTDIPSGKTDVNMNPRPLAFPFAELNHGYVEANWEERERIEAQIRNVTLGLLYFLQNDPEVPATHRQLARQYQLPRDEFADNGHFPFQLYVREGRRLVGEFTLSERNVTDGDAAARHHADAIAVGEFPIDSFPCSSRQPTDTVVLEGYLGMLDGITRPYEIPYRIMIPRRVDSLIVPVAASTTHVAYSSIRMEPTWMALGQAAGVAAHLAATRDVAPRDVPTDELRRLLAEQGQVVELADE
ncbi:MAG: FAD-dependent oxidoreductase [Pirellulales bacterium]